MARSSVDVVPSAVEKQMEEGEFFETCRRLGFPFASKRHPVPPLVPCVFVRVHFSSATLQTLKDIALKSRTPISPSYFSSNDVLVAHLSRIACAAQQTAKKPIGRWSSDASQMTIQMPVNLRAPSRAVQPLTESYFGCAIVNIQVTIPKGASLAVVASAIHNDVANYGARTVVEARKLATLRWMRPHRVTSDLPATSVIYTSWAHFDFMGASDFGTGRPILFTPLPRGNLGMPWTGVITQTASGDGLIANISVPVEYSTRARTLWDWSNPNVESWINESKL